MSAFPHDATPISDVALRIADRASLELIESEFHHDSPWTFYAPWTLLDDAVIEEAVAYLCARGLAERTDSDDLVTVYIKETES